MPICGDGLVISRIVVDHSRVRAAQIARAPAREVIATAPADQVTRDGG